MEQKIKSQVSRIEEWLLSGKPLTAMMAVQLFSCMNLPQVIARLRRGGMTIDKRRERNSEGRMHTLYYLSEARHTSSDGRNIEKELHL